MTEYVYKLKNGKVISVYADEKGNISITKEALEIMVNSWNDGYKKGRADAIKEYTCKSDCEYDGTCEMCVRWDKLADCYEPPKEQLKEQNK